MSRSTLRPSQSARVPNRLAKSFAGAVLVLGLSAGAATAVKGGPPVASGPKGPAPVSPHMPSAPKAAPAMPHPTIPSGPRPQPSAIPHTPSAPRFPAPTPGGLNGSKTPAPASPIAGGAKTPTVIPSSGLKTPVIPSSGTKTPTVIPSSGTKTPVPLVGGPKTPIPGTPSASVPGKPVLPGPSVKPNTNVTVVVIPGGLLTGPRPVVPVTPLVVYPVNPEPVVINRPVIVNPQQVIVPQHVVVDPRVDIVSAPPVVQQQAVVIPAAGNSAAVIPADVNAALRVTERVLDGPAARAGVQLGDIIIRVNGKRVKTADDLQAALAAGRKVEVTYFDAENNKVETKPMLPDGGSLGVTVEVTAVDLEGDAAPPAPPAAEPLPAGTVPALQVTEVTDRGPAARAGLQVGDVILTVGGKKVDSPAALDGALKAGSEVEVLFFNPDDGKAETRKVKVANGGIGAAVRVVALAEK